MTHREPDDGIAALPGDTDGGRRAPGVGDNDEAFPTETIHRIHADLRGCVPPPHQEFGGQARITFHLERDLGATDAWRIEGRDLGPLLK